MNIRRWGACGLAAAALACTATPAMAAGGDLDAYRVKATGKNLRALAEAGFDVTEGRDRKTNTVEVVGTRSQIGALKVDAEKVVDAQGREHRGPLARREPASQLQARRRPDGRRERRELSRLAQVRRRRRAGGRSTSSTRSSTTAWSPSTRTSCASASSARPPRAATSSPSR